MRELVAACRLPACTLTEERDVVRFTTEIGNEVLDPF